MEYRYTSIIAPLVTSRIFPVVADRRVLKHTQRKMLAVKDSRIEANWKTTARLYW